MKKTIGLGVVLLLFTTQAAAVNLGVGVKAGSVGAGIDLSVGLTKTLNARLSLTNIDISGQDETLTVGDDGAELDLDSELDADYGSNALFLDWYIFDGTFHLTAGAFKNNGKLDFTGTLVGTGTIDGQPINAGDIAGDIGGEVSLGDSYQPYIGVGWGRKAGDKPGLSITVDVGVALLDPEVTLEATVIAGGNFADQAELDQTLRDAESDAEDELDDFELFPIVSVGLNYAF